MLTTHAPFVPSDMARDKVFIFGKKDEAINVSHPEIEWLMSIQSATINKYSA